MAFFSVETQKCDGCGACVDECPMRILTLAPGEKTPRLVKENARLCLGCAHCVAVCPSAAFSLAGLGPQDCGQLDPSLCMDDKELEKVLARRRSIRSFLPGPLDRETIERLIALAGHAPSGHNSRPVHWLVTETPAQTRRLAGLCAQWLSQMLGQTVAPGRTPEAGLLIQAWKEGHDLILRGAPHLAIAHAPSADPSANGDCQLALGYLELAASAMGLGACRAGYFTMAARISLEMKEALELPPGHQCYGALMLGRPRHAYHRLPPLPAPRVTWR